MSKLINDMEFRPLLTLRIGLKIRAILILVFVQSFVARVHGYVLVYKPDCNVGGRSLPKNCSLGPNKRFAGFKAVQS